MVKAFRSILKEYNLLEHSRSLENKKLFFSVGDIVSVVYLDIADDEVKKRKFQGLCVAKKSRVNDSSFVLRSSFKGEVIDQKFFFNSPIIVSVSVVYKSTKRASYYKQYFSKV